MASKHSDRGSSRYKSRRKSFAPAALALLFSLIFLGRTGGIQAQSPQAPDVAHQRDLASDLSVSTISDTNDTALFLPMVAWQGTGGPTSHYGRYWLYEGSATCNGCHLAEAAEVHRSVHYQWAGDTPHVAEMDRGGKLGGMNDFCGYPDINFIGLMTNLNGETVDGGCAGCHVGLGKKPETTVSTDQLDNIDCLICHSDDYRRKVEKTGDTFRFVPAPERMAVDELLAITDVHTPTDDACIDCHAYAGGGENNKRGDIEAAHRDPPTRSFDVHMASEAKGGAGLGCLDCHVASNHRIAGRGSDLRPTDLDQPVRCTNCHDAQPHEDREIDRHTLRVDCATCHIPTFAKIRSTDMLRDFRGTEIDEQKRLYEPRITRESMVAPEYRFFNGSSFFYQYDEPYVLGENGRVIMSGPLGDVNDGAKIVPFKHHRAFQAADRSTNKLIPVKMGVLFQTGNVDVAVQQGAAAVGWSLDEGFEFVETERYMGIFHEVAPEEDALTCNDCHRSEDRLDFAALGYTPRTLRQGKPLCESCHEDESDEWNRDEFFKKVHEKHVDEYGEDDDAVVGGSIGSPTISDKVDCIECHAFSSAYRAAN